MDGPTIPPSAIRQPPPPPQSRFSDGSSDSNNGVRWNTNIESILDELLCDILVRLPADFLHDYVKCVCRSWYHLIRSDDFIKKQLQRSTYGLGFSPISESNSYFSHSLYVTATESGQISICGLSSIRENKILVSCNGLAVELHHVNASDELHVINPATKQSFRLPSVSVGNRIVVYHKQCGIAYSAASMKYKVTLPYYDDRLQSTCLGILTVGVDKSWRHVEIPPFLECFCSSPLSSEGGFLHWGKEIDCLTLNVETEAFTMSEAPFPRDHCYDDYTYNYLSTGRYLTLLVGHPRKLLWEVWEMRPLESGEWRKVLPNIDLEAQKCHLQQVFAAAADDDDIDELQEMSPVGWVKYPKVLAFGSWRTHTFYNLETSEINTTSLPNSPWCYYRAIVHRESLVWLSQD